MSEDAKTFARTVPFRRAGDAPPIDWSVTLVLWSQLCLLIVTVVVGRSVAAAHFLSKFDRAGLACAYILVALGVAGLVAMTERLARSWSTFRLAMTTLGISLLGGVVFLGGMQVHDVAESSLFCGLLYLCVECFALLTTIQFWAGVNSIFAYGQARRLYVLVATGGIAGSVVGGTITTFVVSAQPGRAIGVIALLIPCQAALLAIFRSKSRRLRDEMTKSSHGWNEAPFPVPDQVTSAERRTSRSQLRRRLTQRFGWVALLMVFSTTLVDFHYKIQADRQFGGAVTELTSFFGGFYLLVGLLTLMVQVIVTPWLLRRVSPFGGLFASPATLGLLTILNMAMPGLALAALTKLVDSILSHSLYRSCQELLYTPLPTNWVRPVKATAEGVFGRYGLLLAGLFLMGTSLLVEPLGESVLAGTIALSLLAWLGAVGSLRRALDHEVDRAGSGQPERIDLPELATDGAEGEAENERRVAA
ncbi:TLC ATP/ADP transporter [Planctomycetes bacterium Pan216]|uniref:TLC ATP/ADP transporter n=1 Tax=Kolteria novifilia TaxID=2527975 RepID=A0A518B1P4_9BACT|nr:TLC ATP/ADP transporter [Planctomycetes bacterium Pan216]